MSDITEPIENPTEEEPKEEPVEEVTEEPTDEPNEDDPVEPVDEEEPSKEEDEPTIEPDPTPEPEDEDYPSVTESGYYLDLLLPDNTVDNDVISRRCANYELKYDVTEIPDSLDPSIISEVIINNIYIGPVDNEEGAYDIKKELISLGLKAAVTYIEAPSNETPSPK